MMSKLDIIIINKLKNVTLIIIFCSLIMMKKYERVNLASDIYREKPTSRSPIALKKV